MYLNLPDTLLRGDIGQEPNQTSTPSRPPPPRRPLGEPDREGEEQTTARLVESD